MARKAGERSWSNDFRRFDRIYSEALFRLRLGRIAVFGGFGGFDFRAALYVASEAGSL